MEITEEFLMGLLCNAGAARSSYMGALQAAKKGDFLKASADFKEAEEAMNEVHHQQTSLIGYDEGEGKVKMTLILTHIQDHIMTTMLCRDLVQEMIEIHKLLQESK